MLSLGPSCNGTMCLGGTNNIISPLGKPDFLIVQIGVIPFGKKRNIKARQIIIQVRPFFIVHQLIFSYVCD